MPARQGVGQGHVSIHAPARGATRQAVQFQRDGLVSIHAPARGATVMPPSSAPAPQRFNPRAREGRDEPGFFVDIFDAVSIHAPARGATLVSLCFPI